MTPNIPLPTDNIYKFLSLFGLVLIAVSMFSFATIYSNYLGEMKKTYTENLILEAKQEPTKEEKILFESNKSYIEIVNSNQKHSTQILSAIFGAGVLMSFYSMLYWLLVIQKRDDKLVETQIKRIELENAKLQLEAERIKLETERLAIEVGQLRGPSGPEQEQEPGV